MNHRPTELRSRSRSELDEIFSRAEPGPIPAGPARGTALILPGSVLDRALGALVRWFCWKGKIFRPETGDLKNRISPLGIPAIRALVYLDESWFTEGEAIILDYSRSSFVARKVRDEIRRVGPGTYLGQVFWGRRRLILFMLEFPEGADAGRSGAAA